LRDVVGLKYKDAGIVLNNGLVTMIIANGFFFREVLGSDAK
jgi:hypothetical protein